MEGCKRGSITPSYSQTVSSRDKKPLEAETGFLGGGKQDIKDTQEEENMREDVKREKRIEEYNQNSENKNQNGPCKPRTTITPRVVLSDSALQAHRDHMATYVVICKFMGLWPTC